MKPFTKILLLFSCMLMVAGVAFAQDDGPVKERTEKVATHPPGDITPVAILVLNLTLPPIELPNETQTPMVSDITTTIAPVACLCSLCVNRGLSDKPVPYSDGGYTAAVLRHCSNTAVEPLNAPPDCT